MRHLPWWKKLAYALLAISVMLGTVEITLRLVGFRFDANELTVIAHGERQKPMLRYVRPGLWAAAPDSETFNEDGFVGPKIPLKRSPGVLRIATLGDSCTQWGDPPYPEILGKLLQSRLHKPVEVLNAGVIRYSTEQGLQRLKERVLPYRPDIVTIYFGWNDHWMSEVKTDAHRLAEALPTAAQWLQPLEASRAVQAILLLAEMIHERIESKTRTKRQYVFRVPPENYVENLRMMVRLIRSNGATPVLITAPTEGKGNVADWGWMLAGFHDQPYQDYVQLHDKYVELTREVARSECAPLVDARAEFSGDPALMLRDQIHLSPVGIQRLAELLAKTILENNIPPVTGFAH